MHLQGQVSRYLEAAFELDSCLVISFLEGLIHLDSLVQREDGTASICLLLKLDKQFAIFLLRFTLLLAGDDLLFIIDGVAKINCDAVDLDVLLVDSVDQIAHLVLVGGLLPLAVGDEEEPLLELVLLAVFDQHIDTNVHHVGQVYAMLRLLSLDFLHTAEELEIDVLRVAH